MDEKIEISAPAQYKALGHPLRHRLLFALGHEPGTISGLATSLGQRKGTIAHHLKVLQEAGLVEIVETRPVRGGTEHRYLRTAKKLIFSGPEADPVAMRAVADEMAAAQAVLAFRIRSLRLTAAQARTLAETLEALVDGLDEAADEARHTVVTTVYRSH